MNTVLSWQPHGKTNIYKCLDKLASGLSPREWLRCYWSFTWDDQNSTHAHHLSYIRPEGRSNCNVTCEISSIFSLINRKYSILVIHHSRSTFSLLTFSTWRAHTCTALYLFTTTAGSCVPSVYYPVPLTAQIYTQLLLMLNQSSGRLYCTLSMYRWPVSLSVIGGVECKKLNDKMLIHKYVWLTTQNVTEAQRR